MLDMVDKTIEDCIISDEGRRYFVNMIMRFVNWKFKTSGDSDSHACHDFGSSRACWVFFGLRPRVELGFSPFDDGNCVQGIEKTLLAFDGLETKFTPEHLDYELLQEVRCGRGCASVVSREM